MTAPIATGTYALLRGVSTDAYSDEIDLETEVAGYGSIVGSVIEQTQQTSRKTDQAPRDVRRFIGRIPAFVPVQDEDRLRDNATRVIYTIASFRTVVNPITGSVTKLNLILST